MASPLAGGLAKTIGKAMAGLFLPATLARDTAAPASPASDPWNPGGPTTATYPCRAIHEEYAERYRLEGLMQAGDRKVLILAASLTVEPKPGDRVTIRGETFTIAAVATDPAKACWECRARA